VCSSDLLTRSPVHDPARRTPLTRVRGRPEPLTPPALAPGRTTVTAAEEVAHGLREILQRLLLDDDRPRPQPRECRPRLGQLPALLGEPRRTLTSRPPARVLLNREIPHKPGMPAMLQQRLLLSRRCWSR